MPTTDEIMLQVRQIIEEHLQKQEAERQKRLQYLNDLIDALDLQNGWPKPGLIFTTREQAEAWGLKIEETEENDD
jgi:hypothetical protein